MSRRGLMDAPLAVFLGVAFGGAILLSLLIGLTGGERSAWMPLSVLTMFLPALGVLAVRFAFGIPLPLASKSASLRWFAVALLALPIAIHLAVLPGVAVLEGRLPWVDWLTPAADGLYHTPAERGWGALTAPVLAGRIVLNAAVGLVVVSFLAFFEEIGWRAFFLARLAERSSMRRAAVVSAMIYALWHIPFALAGIQYVENVSPWELALLLPIGHFGFALFLAFLWFKTESVLLVSVAHGALNNWGQYAFKFMHTSGQRDLALFALVNAVLLVVGAAALAGLRPGRGSTQFA